MEDSWLENVLQLIPESLKRKVDSVNLLSEEMREGYHMSVKKAIVDFVLKDPREKNEYGLEVKDSMEEFKMYSLAVSYNLEIEMLFQVGGTRTMKTRYSFNHAFSSPTQLSLRSLIIGKDLS